MLVQKASITEAGKNKHTHIYITSVFLPNKHC